MTGPMGNAATTHEGESIRAIVTSEKADVLNTGAVKDSAEQSKSTLRERGSALGQRASAAAVKTGGGNGKNAAKLTGKPAGKATSANAQLDKEAGTPAAMEGARKRGRLATMGSGMGHAAASALADELDDSEELEGLGDLYRRTVAAKRTVSRVRNAKSAKSAGAYSSKGAVSRTKAARAAKAKAAEKTARSQAAAMQAQAARQATAAAAESAAAAAGKGAAVKGIGAAVASAAAPLAGVIAGILAFVMGILLVSQLLGAVFGFWENEATKSVGTLTGVEQEIALALREYGFSDAAIAAVLGNLKAESGMDPTSDSIMDGQFNYSYERACGLFQYTSTSPGSGEYWNFKNWCSSSGKEWSSVSAQMEWTFSGEQPGTWSSSWSTALARSGYYSNCPGYTDGAYYTASEFKNANDVDKATYSWMACYERPANGQYAHLDRRIEYAREYYAALTTTVPEYAGSNVIVAAAYSQLGVPYVWGGSTPGVGLDCSGLTQYCYAQAGVHISHYTEYQRAELTAVPLSQAQPGDILYRPGHVAIYIGDDQYIHEPQTGDVCKISTGIGYFTCALRAS